MSFVKEYRKTMKKVISKVKDKDYDYRQTYQKRLMDFRKFTSTVTKTEKPINLVRAKTLGYKAKKGIFTVVVRARRGGGLFRPEHNGRRPKRMGFTKLTRNISIRRICELRASDKYTNCEVLNSYNVGEDGKYKYFEVILISKNQPEVQKDKALKKVALQKGRAQRGLTSAGRKNRGLRKVRQTTKK
jgi:large subunit ribosomal protein L15e